ncbi:MAG TPA: MFS transporter [Candidatus Brocadiia bacterium]|nr:MFS transporter [Candidatus Brocadiia bacterium]
MPPSEAGHRPRLLDAIGVPLLFFLLFMGVGATQLHITDYARQLAGHASPWTRRLFAPDGLNLAPLLVAVIYLVFAPSRLLGVWFISRFGRAWTIRAGVLCYLGLAVVLWIGRSPWLILTGCVSIGAGGGLLWTASDTHVLDRAAAARYGRAAGLLQTLSRSGMWIGALLFAWLVRQYTYFGHPFFPFGASAAIGAVALALAMRLRSPPVAVQPPSWAGLRQTLARPRLPLVAGLLFLAFFGYGLLLGHLMPVIQRVFEKQNMPFLAPAYFISGLLCSWLGGILSDRLGRWPVLLGGYALGGFSMLIMTRFSPDMPAWLLCAALLLLGAPFGVTPTVVAAWVGDAADPAGRPILHACAFLWRDLGAVAAAVLAVWLGRPATLAPGFYAMAAVFFAPSLAAGALLLLRPRRPR